MFLFFAAFRAVVSQMTVEPIVRGRGVLCENKRTGKRLLGLVRRKLASSLKQNERKWIRVGRKKKKTPKTTGKEKHFHNLFVENTDIHAFSKNLGLREAVFSLSRSLLSALVFDCRPTVFWQFLGNSQRKSNSRQRKKWDGSTWRSWRVPCERWQSGKNWRC